HLLYLHRRLVKGGLALDRLTSNTSVRDVLPVTFANLQEELARYRSDPEVVAASGLYEKAHGLFERLRQVLRLTARGDSPMNDSYEVTEEEQTEMKEDLLRLREQCKEAATATRAKTEEERLSGIVSEHLEGYWEELGGGKAEERKERTTNALERKWL